MSIDRQLVRPYSMPTHVRETTSLPMLTRLLGLGLLPLFVLLAPCAVSAQSSSRGDMRSTVWLTTPDRKALLTPQRGALVFTAQSATQNSSAQVPSIQIDETHVFQTIDGFGFALTGGSAQLLMRMTPAARHALLLELFGTAATAKNRPIGVSYLRLSIGSSDMNEHVFTYDDLPTGRLDLELRHFELGPDLKDVVPVLQEILKISPKIQILGTPWSAPAWMKTVEAAKGGSLKPEYYDVYALYLARYIKAMAAHGIRIDAITPQNEPLNPKNTPSMVMTSEEEGAFIHQSLGPIFKREKIDAKIILYDHNCDSPDYPLAILADKDAAQYVDGSGFHLYGGTIDAMTKVHEAYPRKNLYFTEQMVVDSPKEEPELRLAEPVKEIVIGATSNWSRNVLLWNLAADPSFGPHTNNGGCPVCEGAITLDGDTVTRNAAYYTIAHASIFVRPGSRRIATTVNGSVPAEVAFRGINGQMILLTANPTSAAEDFEIRFHGHVAKASLPPGAVATYVW